MLISTQVPEGLSNDEIAPDNIQSTQPRPYELRYNRDQIIGRGMMFNRLDYRWADVQKVDIVDDRTFHLIFENGDRMQIYKSLQHVAEFIAFAQARASQNRTTQPAMTDPKSGWSAFGFRKTFP